MLKQGNDHFEVTQLEPKVDVCEQHYVFNAEKEPNASRPVTFNPTGKCPAYIVQDDIAQAVAEKQRKDEFETAELITRGTPTAVARKGIDGGMHALFAAKTPNGNTGHSEAKNYSFAAYSAVPSVPPTVNPPASPDTPVAFAAAPNNTGGEYVSSSPSSPAAASAAPRAEPKQPATSPVRVAAAQSSNSEGFFSSLARKMGLGGSDTTASTGSTSAKPTPKPKPVAAAKPPASANVKSSEPKGETRSAAKPEPKERDTAMAGAQPVVPSNAFDSRWSLR
jgi:hypothetical protein